MRYVFVLGVARSGSRIYINVITPHSSIDIAPELHYISPPWLRRDFCQSVRKKIGDLDSNEKIRRLVDLMFSGKLVGRFWQEIKLDKQLLERKLKQSDKSFKSILAILLEERAMMFDKQIAGAKYPVNIACFKHLIEWFPEAQILHITRDPRAVYSSMVQKDYQTRQIPGKHILVPPARFLYLCNQFHFSALLHKQMKNQSNYLLTRFEDIINCPESSLRRLCSFLQIDYKTEMLTIPVVDSSYGNVSKQGFDQKTLTRWKMYLSKPIQRLIGKTLVNPMRTLGYE